MTLARCIHCFAQNSCVIRFDKRGRPYTSCRTCFTRCFFSTMEPLRGVAVCPELIDTVLKTAERDESRKKWVQERIRTVQGFVRDKMTGAGLPSVGADPVPYAGEDAAAEEKIA